MGTTADRELPTERRALVSTDVEATIALGRALGQLVEAGDVIALSGDLGAGKTHLVKGIVSGAGGAPAEDVVSPTFVLLVPYDGGRVTIHHVDAYRLGGPEELLDLGAIDLFADGVGVVEWAERVEAALPRERLGIALDYGEEPSERTLALEATGVRPVALLRALDRALAEAGWGSERRAT